MRSTLSPLTVQRVPYRIDRQEVMMARAKALRDKTDSLFELENSLKNSRANLDVRSSELDKREFQLRRREAKLEERECTTADRPPAQEPPRLPELKRRVADPAYKSDVLPTDAKALAARIIEMGRVRRAEISYRGMEPTLPMAKMIIAAAAKARSIAPPPELPEHPVARAIVLAGQKARGTIDSAGERWLADYLARAEAIRGLMS
jgi:hypothetical protein